MKPDYAALAATFGPQILAGKLGRPAVVKLTGLGEKQARNLLAYLKGRQDAEAQRPAPAAPEVPAAPQSVETTTDASGEQTVTSNGARIRTVDDLIAAADIDLTRWEVVWAQVNKYEMGRKAQTSHLDYRDGKAHGKVRDAGGVHVEELFQVKLKLKPRRDLLALEDLKDAALEEVRAEARKRPAIRARAPQADNLLYVGVHDLHPGKLAHAEETGHDWNPELAERVALAALTRLLEKAERHGVSRIVLPVGHDLAHVDGPNNATTAGTAQDVSQRYHLMRRHALKLARRMVDVAAQLAPVQVVAVPGNHGRVTDLVIVEMLGAIFEGDARVRVDTPLAPRSYLQHGTNLLGFTHGDRVKHADLPLIMAAETPHLWADTQQREWLLGHHHSMKLLETHGQEIKGIRVRVLPALCASDYWHAAQGYVNSVRALEGYLYHAHTGYEGHVNVNLKEVV